MLVMKLYWRRINLNIYKDTYDLFRKGDIVKIRYKPYCIGEIIEPSIIGGITYYVVRFRNNEGLAYDALFNLLKLELIVSEEEEERIFDGWMVEYNYYNRLFDSILNED